MSGILATLIWFGVIWYIISKVANKGSDVKKNRTNINGKPMNKQNQTAEMVGSLVRENVAKFEKQASQWMNATPSPKGQSYHAPKAPTSDIVQRAKANTKKYEADETLHELESEHKHSEKVSSAEAAYVAKDREEHMKMHTEPTPRVEDESLLGGIEDLMVKGYDGNLSFERDFLGEAMDMINRFTLAD